MQYSILSIFVATLALTTPALAQDGDDSSTSTSTSASSTSKCNYAGCGTAQAAAFAPATAIPMIPAAIAGMGALGYAALL